MVRLYESASDAELIRQSQSSTSLYDQSLSGEALRELVIRKAEGRIAYDLPNQQQRIYEGGRLGSQATAQQAREQSSSFSASYTPERAQELAAEQSRIEAQDVRAGQEKTGRFVSYLIERGQEAVAKLPEGSIVASKAGVFGITGGRALTEGQLKLVRKTEKGIGKSIQGLKDFVKEEPVSGLDGGVSSMANVTIAPPRGVKAEFEPGLYQGYAAPYQAFLASFEKESVLAASRQKQEQFGFGLTTRAEAKLFKEAPFLKSELDVNETNFPKVLALAPSEFTKGAAVGIILAAPSTLDLVKELTVNPGRAGSAFVSSFGEIYEPYGFGQFAGPFLLGAKAGSLGKVGRLFGKPAKTVPFESRVTFVTRGTTKSGAQIAGGLAETRGKVGDFRVQSKELFISKEKLGAKKPGTSTSVSIGKVRYEQPGLIPFTKAVKEKPFTALTDTTPLATVGKVEVFKTESALKLPKTALQKTEGSLRLFPEKTVQLVGQRGVTKGVLTRRFGATQLTPFTKTRGTIYDITGRAPVKQRIFAPTESFGIPGEGVQIMRQQVTRKTPLTFYPSETQGGKFVQTQISSAKTRQSFVGGGALGIGATRARQTTRIRTTSVLAPKSNQTTRLLSSQRFQPRQTLSTRNGLALATTPRPRVSSFLMQRQATRTIPTTLLSPVSNTTQRIRFAPVTSTTQRTRTIQLITPAIRFRPQTATITGPRRTVPPFTPTRTRDGGYDFLLPPPSSKRRREGWGKKRKISSGLFGRKTQVIPRADILSLFRTQAKYGVYGTSNVASTPSTRKAYSKFLEQGAIGTFPTFQQAKQRGLFGLFGITRRNKKNRG